ncbi:MAG TPA: SLC13 family permease [Thermoanaerobaculia bacterium]|nr:SLC13 family permease [Thermoanaerobaculia bacterium]
MGPKEIEVLVVSLAALLLVLSGRIRADLVALLVVAALGLGRILPVKAVFAGFSSSVTVTIAGLFVITSAFEETGAVNWFADRVSRFLGHGQRSVAGVFMVAGAVASLVMSTIAAAAVLVPASVQISRRAKVPESKVLMPLGFGTLLGGMATLFTSANIIVGGALEAQGQSGLTMWDFLRIGGLTAVAGILFMMTVGYRLLPSHPSAGRKAVGDADLQRTYRLAERLWEVQVTASSRIAGLTLADSALGSRLGLTVIAIWRGKEAIIPPTPQERVLPGDILLVLGRDDRVDQLGGMGLAVGRGHSTTSTTGPALPVALSEVVIGPRSSAIGHTLKDLRFRNRFGLTTVALWRGGRSFRTDVGDFELDAGDALLMVGPQSAIEELATEPGFLVLERDSGLPPRARGRALLTVAVAGIALVSSALGWVPMAEAMLGGAVALVLFRCLSIEQAYRAIDWRVILLIGGFMPLGAALVDTGLTDLLTTGLGRWLGGVGPIILIAVLYLIAAALAQLVGGQVAALIIAPIAISLAMNLGIDARAAGVTVAVACSAAFLTPIAHPVNLLTMGPGGYVSKDFVRVGWGLLATCFVVTVAAVALVFHVAM